MYCDVHMILLSFYCGQDAKKPGVKARRNIFIIILSLQEFQQFAHLAINDVELSSFSNRTPLGAYKVLVSFSDFKSDVAGQNPAGWVRFPHALATATGCFL